MLPEHIPNTYSAGGIEINLSDTQAVLLDCLREISPKPKRTDQLAAYSRLDTKTTRKELSRLKEKGYVSRKRGKWKATVSGIVYLRKYEKVLESE